MRKQGTRMAGLLAISAVMAITGCGNAANTAQNGSAAGERQESATPAASGAGAGHASEDTGKKIYLYGNDFVEIVAPLFAEKTGYEIEAVHYGGGEALAKVEAERGNPQWDVLMMDGHGSFRSLADRDFLLTGWQPEGLANLTEFGASQVPGDYAYYPIGIHAAGLIAYNTNLVSAEQAPKSWEQFFAYNGPVGHADPAVAAPAYPLVSSFFHKWGVEETKEIYKQRMTDGLNVYPKNGPVGQALISGEIHVAALQEHNAYSLKLAGEPVEVIWPEEGAPGSLRMAAISKQTKNPAAAKAFVEFMLSAEVQRQLTALESNDSFFTPLAEGVSMRGEREQDGVFLLPAADWSAEHEQEIKTWFADQNVN